MDGQEKLLDYETIKAAVAGEKWATEKVLAHYADYIDEAFHGGDQAAGRQSEKSH